MTVRVEWLTAGEREAVYAEALDILQRVGMRMKGAAVLPLLREAGAEVDEDGTVTAAGRAGGARRRRLPARRADGRAESRATTCCSTARGRSST